MAILKHPLFDTLKYRLTSPYGYRTIGNQRVFHDGVDYGLPLKTPLKFLSAGTIRAVRTDKYGGKYVQLRRNDGKGEWHLHCDSIIVKQGQVVKKGQVVAYSGNTGLSTAPHTHYGMQKDANKWNSHIDPMPFINAEIKKLNAPKTVPAIDTKKEVPVVLEPVQPVISDAEKELTSLKLEIVSLKLDNEALQKEIERLNGLLGKKSESDRIEMTENNKSFLVDGITNLIKSLLKR